MSSRHCVCESVYLAWCLSQNRRSVHDLSIVSAICLFSVPFSTHSPFHPSLLLFFPSLSGFSLLSHFSLTCLEQHIIPVTLHILPSKHLLPSCPLTPAGFPFKGAMGRCLPTSDLWFVRLCTLVHTALYTTFPSFRFALDNDSPLLVKASNYHHQTSSQMNHPQQLFPI